ncbi:MULTISPECIES: alpha/beta fold hydrolase [Clostridium]|uniref:Lysophospholipase n=2 Tax=Clostridium TaxID=1485 RepID=A0A2U8DTE9_9CLOT|nr:MULTISPECIES: alpha/beta fold hydrolase [Clostridium]AKA67895.1 putative lysophospholipase [Clostridium scatologenes]AWI05695.1 lysophospholipase [Clostridium drakei]
MSFQEKSFKSFNEKDTIQAWIYTPIRKPRGIVQIVHGFGEHSRRYLHMILKLNEAGFVVAADDHVGHGKTASDSGNWSDWGDKGYMTMAEDEHTLRKIVQEEYPNLPYFMYGHSMGSMIARCYAAAYGKGIDGIILCGTSGVFPNAAELVPILEKEINEGKGKETDLVSLNKLLGWMTNRCENPTTANDWICGDPDVVADHANDPFNNFKTPPNVRSLYHFVKMMDSIVGTQWAEKVPTSIPVYNMAGDQDPVGQYGEGVYAVSNWLAETGHKVKTKVYPGKRHEIHNYRDIRDEVEDGMIDFMNSIIEK